MVSSLRIGTSYFFHTIKGEPLKGTLRKRFWPERRKLAHQFLLPSTPPGRLPRRPTALPGPALHTVASRRGHTCGGAGRVRHPQWGRESSIPSCLVMTPAGSFLKKQQSRNRKDTVGSTLADCHYETPELSQSFLVTHRLSLVVANNQTPEGG